MARPRIISKDELARRNSEARKRLRRDLVKGPIFREKCRQYERSRPLVTRMLKAAKARARANGLEFTITEIDITIPERCPIFNVKLGPVGDRYAPSLDRIDNNKGYIAGNVRVVSRCANAWKSDLTVDDARRFLAYMERNNET